MHRPGFYAQRFQDFMAKTVFKKIPSREYIFYVMSNPNIIYCFVILTKLVRIYANNMKKNSLFSYRFQQGIYIFFYTLKEIILETLWFLLWMGFCF